MTHAFISYVREDKDIVDRLCAELEARGIDAWLDRNKIEPGASWKDAIRHAIEKGSFFLACYSANSCNKASSYMNQEINLAINELQLRPAHTAWFIPIVLDKIEASDLKRALDRDIGGMRNLRDLNYVDLHANWQEGIMLIAKALGAPTTSKVDLNHYRAAYDVNDYDSLHVCVERTLSYEPLNLGTSPITHRPSVHYELHEKSNVIRMLLRIYKNQPAGWALLHTESGTLIDDHVKKRCAFESAHSLTIDPGTIDGPARYRIEFLERLIMRPSDRDILACYGTARNVHITCQSSTRAFEFNVGDLPRLSEIRKGSEWTLQELRAHEVIAIRWEPTRSST